MATDPRQTLLENLDALMRRAGLTKRALALKAGVSENTIYLVFRGDNRNRIDIVERLAQVFNLPAWRLLRPDVLKAQPDQHSDTAMDVAAMFDRLPESRRARAYALIVQLLEFENEGEADTALPSDPPRPEHARTHRGKRPLRVRP